MGRSSASPTARRARVPHQPTIQKHRDTRTENNPAGVTGRHEATGQDREQTIDDEARRLVRALLSMHADKISIPRHSDEFKSLREPVEHVESHSVSIESVYHISESHGKSAERRYPTPEAEELERQLAEFGVGCQYIYIGGGDDPEVGPFRFLSFNMRDVWNKLGDCPREFSAWLQEGARDGLGA